MADEMDAEMSWSVPEKRMEIPEKRMEIPENLINFPGAILSWYRANARDLPWRHTCDPYPIWVSEIMLQQTRAAAVTAYYHRFLTAFPDISTLAAASEEDVFSLWQGLGYYTRARNLRKAAQWIDERGAFPDDYAGLLRLPGVGPYTAAAIASAAFGRPCAAVDGNVLRVLARLTASPMDIRRPETKTRFREILQMLFPSEEADIRIFNQAVMELGATVCVPNGEPKCDVCPVLGQCAGYATGRVREYPVKGVRKSRRMEQRTVMVFLREDTSSSDRGHTLSGNIVGNHALSGENHIQTALCKRPDRGLLAGLWEFPNVTGALDETQAAELVQRWGLRPIRLYRRLETRHIFTHIEWHMTGYVFGVTADDSGTVDSDGWSGENIRSPDWHWVDRAGVETYAIPSAFGRFRETVMEYMESGL